MEDDSTDAGYWRQIAGAREMKLEDVKGRLGEAVKQTEKARATVDRLRTEKVDLEGQLDKARQDAANRYIRYGEAEVKLREVTNRYIRYGEAEVKLREVTERLHALEGYHKRIWADQMDNYGRLQDELEAAKEELKEAGERMEKSLECADREREESERKLAVAEGSNRALQLMVDSLARQVLSPFLKPSPESADNSSAAILREAADIVNGPRSNTHGDKERSFEAIAEHWTTYLRNRLDPNGDVRPSDVAALMVLMKFARGEQGSWLRDHAVDAAGYSGMWGELKAKEANNGL